MEEAFEKLKRDAKLIDEAAAEEKARKLFEGVKDAKNVELEKFKEVVAKLAAEQKKNVEDFTKRLGEQGTRLLNAAMAGASAFKDALAKK
ncbi:uncharacterized protein LOC115447042 isoform X2 [Manduca sexta]|uniref:Uncharacterized protein n=1 Tax=Manduca sexta TaxID=7130 RepID=A0A921ZDX9_MANSE|nr:uncharacterized protein LOC115447042 isoform X2 [Manduca sexta]KAG6455636.1 hypothetical protein O3G_MSEX009297 [Manduca sexta]